MNRLGMVVGVAAALVVADTLCRGAEPGYSEDWKSLAAHNEAPEWYRDAKFGIYFHWGVYSVPAFGNEWYPRWMHVPGAKHRNKYEYHKHHLEKYGDPSKFGYHDFVPMFKAEKFDAEEWADLFQRAGARYAGPVAEHHDGFAMWASKVTPWNAADMGPKRDITGELAKACRARGMKFVATFHHARNLQRYSSPEAQEVENAKTNPRWAYQHSHYPYVKGQPPTSTDAKLRLLYGNLPEEEWLERIWFGKLKEVIDQYQPDLIWFDSWLNQIPENYLQKFCAYYLNHAATHGKEVVITRKQEDMPLSVSLEDFEKGRMDQLTEHCWLTDDTISLGSWCYTEDLEIKPVATVLHSLIDMVSKNGCLLLNISPKADGSIPQNQRDVLLAMGAWLKINGEAIYGTRPWIRYGEGPTTIGKSGGFIKEPTYIPQDIRYTASKDDLVLYATLMGWPGAGKTVTLTSVHRDTKIKSVRMFGTYEEIEWTIDRGGLTLTMPSATPSELAVCFRIEKGYGKPE
jgi:alpha-L-fucosidase